MLQYFNLSEAFENKNSLLFLIKIKTVFLLQAIIVLNTDNFEHFIFMYIIKYYFLCINTVFKTYLPQIFIYKA